MTPTEDRGPWTDSPPPSRPEIWKILKYGPCLGTWTQSQSREGSPSGSKVVLSTAVMENGGDRETDRPRVHGTRSGSGSNREKCVGPQSGYGCEPVGNPDPRYWGKEPGTVPSVLRGRTVSTGLPRRTPFLLTGLDSLLGRDGRD